MKETMVSKSGSAPTVSCWLCERSIKVRFSKKDKPYLVCICGVQTFIRYKQAEDLLAEKVRMESEYGEV